MSLPFQQISGQPLDAEQTAYLEGLFAGLRNRGLGFGDLVPSGPVPAASAAAATPDLSELTDQERIKRELHPLDAYSLLLQHAASDQAPDPDNAFRFKWQGLFSMSPMKEGYMARLRIPGGQLTSAQLREIAAVADSLTTGYLQITTRANLQLRHIRFQDAPEFLRRIQAVGLHTRGTGADNIRNLTCDPTSGLDPSERLETLPLTLQLGQLILNHREFYDLPRKFNIAFHGGGTIPTVEDTNDIGWKAVRVWSPAECQPAPEGSHDLRPGDLVTASVPSGLYFRCLLGGATGHKAFARDLGILVPPEEVVRVTAAMVRVYLAHGDRTDRKRARLKHLLEHWTLDRFRTETEALLGRPLLGIPEGSEAAVAHGDDPVATMHPHLGVHAQRQAGLHWIGVAVPVGQVSSRQLRRLAELAEWYGSGEVRLTVWQNLIVPNIPEAYVETVKKALVKAGLDWRSSALRGGFIACTGNRHCRFAASDTKGHALRLIEWLDSRVSLDQPVNIHLTGCPNSCAQHYMGDIGLLGTQLKRGGQAQEAYHVFVGGGFGPRQAIGRAVFQGVILEELGPLLERMLRVYLRDRHPGETFQGFTSRHDLGRLQELFADSPSRP
ncbi:MAG: NirA family protein [Verrucomicrobium sp.]|jgi:ferredoxin-nitrite reductase|nr:NirA family protein [Verrucomicrobium sp.]